MNLNNLPEPKEIFKNLIEDKKAVDIQIFLSDQLLLHGSDICRGFEIEIDLMGIYKKANIDWSIVQNYSALILSQKGYKVKIKGSCTLVVSLGF